MDVLTPTATRALRCDVRSRLGGATTASTTVLQCNSFDPDTETWLTDRSRATIRFGRDPFGLALFSQIRTPILQQPASRNSIAPSRPTLRPGVALVSSSSALPTTKCWPGRFFDQDVTGSPFPTGGKGREPEPCRTSFTAAGAGNIGCRGLLSGHRINLRSRTRGGFPLTRSWRSSRPGGRDTVKGCTFNGDQ